MNLLSIHQTLCSAGFQPFQSEVGILSRSEIRDTRNTKLYLMHQVDFLLIYLRRINDAAAGKNVETVFLSNISVCIREWACKRFIAHINIGPEECSPSDRREADYAQLFVGSHPMCSSSTSAKTTSILPPWRDNSHAACHIVWHARRAQQMNPEALFPRPRRFPSERYSKRRRVKHHCLIIRATLSTAAGSLLFFSSGSGSP